MSDWRDRAACLGMDTSAFFPDAKEQTPWALDVCKLCTARIDCAQDAIAMQDFAGIRGGVRISMVKGTRSRSIAKLRAVAKGLKP